MIAAVSAALPSSGLRGDRFHAARPDDLRAAKPWHRFSYIIEALPRAIAALMLDLRLTTGARVLDYGCAEMPYRDLLPAGTDLVGADLPGNPNATIDVRSDGTVPVDDDTFDAVLSTQVLEHVADPAVYLAECARVLRPGGRLLLSTHGIMVWHPDPVDLWRWTSEGLRTAVERAGLEVERFEGVMGLGASRAATAAGRGLPSPAPPPAPRAGVDDPDHDQAVGAPWRRGRPTPECTRLCAGGEQAVTGRLHRVAQRVRRARRAVSHARLQQRLAGPKLLSALAETLPEPFFVEIGANDGQQHDHLQPYILDRAVARNHGRAGAIHLRAPAGQLRGRTERVS